jgi:hypothetical protein
MKTFLLYLGILGVVGFSLSVCLAQYPYDDVYGCEANPTGNPIGGGVGYTDIHTTGDYVVTTFDELLEALGKAQAGEVVFVPDGTEIDLTGHGNISIPGGVTLAGTRGLNGSAGARLYNNPPAYFKGFRTDGENVRLTGLRFDGGYGERRREVWRDTLFSIRHRGAQVDNCEIYNFSAGAIGVGGYATRTHVHHNDFHHIQRDGLGYPVSVGGGDIRVIANKFDYGRHHVASSGIPGCGYEAAWNLIGPNATSTHFDMHGGRDRSDGTDIAGDWMHIHHNTFLSTNRHVGIRGKPSQGAEVHNNWFARSAEESVYATGNTRVYKNIIGPDKTPQATSFKITALGEGNVPVIEPLADEDRPLWLDN